MDDMDEASGGLLRRRSTPDRLRHLAGKLREGDGNRDAVALTLEVMADEAGQLAAERGIDYFLDRAADSLAACPERPCEVRDIAESLRRKAAAIRAEKAER